MANLLAGDQADGLRRLLARNFARIITVAGGKGIGKSTAVANLAGALARGGRRVMILDGQNGMERMLGIKPRHDLLEVIRRKKTLAEVMLPAAEGVAVVPAAKAVKVLGDLSEGEQEWLTQAFAQSSERADVVLVDGVGGFVGNALSPSLAAHDVVVVLSPEPQAITDAYALIKVLSQAFGRRHFHVLINKAARPQDAQPVFENMSGTAQRFLGAVSLDYLGAIPLDPKLRQAARLGRPVVDAFPDSIGATAFRRLVGAVDEWPYPSDDEGRLEGFLERLIHSSRVAAEFSRASS